MKNSWFIIPLTLVFASCSNHSSDVELVEKYYQGLNEGDYKKVASVLSNQFIMRENESKYEVTFTPEKFHDWFQWDSVFNPVYVVSKIELKNDTVFATISKKCDRILFLHETPIANLAYFEILNGKIHAINRYKYTNANWEVWTKNRTSLIQWVKENQPELDGFLSQQNREYGHRYDIAIEQYNARQQ